MTSVSCNISEIYPTIFNRLYVNFITIHGVILLLVQLRLLQLLERLIYLKYANPVLWMWSDELRQSVMTFQRCMGQVTLPHILEDDVGKV